VGIDNPSEWTLILIAAMLSGIAGGLLLVSIVPGGVGLRALLVAAIGLALAGLPTVTVVLCHSRQDPR